jgi:hypothetical protein
LENPIAEGSKTPSDNNKTTEMKYFIITNDVQQGPFTLDELRARGIQSDTLVWCEGMTDWQPAWQVAELKPLFYGAATPPPPPTSTIGVDQPQPQAPAGGQQPPQAQQPNVAANMGTASAAGGSVPPTTPQAPVPQKKSHYKRNIVLIVLGVLLLVAVFTNPSASEHRDVIKTNLVAAVVKTFGTGSDDIISQGLSVFGQTVAAPIVGEVVDNMTTYHNYLLWSTTTISYDDKDQKTSFGIFGHVFTMDEEQLASLISKSLNNKVHVSTRVYEDDGPIDGSSVDDNATTEGVDDTTGIGSLEDEINKTVSDAASKLGSQLIDKVSKRMKDELKQQTDSATSGTVDQLIDDIVEFFKVK